MKIEDQVCSLEQAKRLDNLGLDLPSNFYWIENQLERWFVGGVDCIGYDKSGDLSQTVKAYTVAELGVLLGKYTVMKYAADKNWRLYDDYGVLRGWLHEGTEAQARADALIWLIENDYVKAEDLKL